MAETFQWSPKHVLVNFREYLQTDTEGEKIIPSTCFSWNMCVGGVFRFLVIYLGSETQTIAIRIKKDPSSSSSLSLCPLHCWAFSPGRWVGVIYQMDEPLLHFDSFCAKDCFIILRQIFISLCVPEPLQEPPYFWWCPPANDQFPRGM